MRRWVTIWLQVMWGEARHFLLPGSSFGTKLKLKKEIPVHNINTKKISSIL
jgi:hypothetical protein